MNFHFLKSPIFGCSNHCSQGSNSGSSLPPKLKSKTWKVQNENSAAFTQQMWSGTRKNRHWVLGRANRSTCLSTPCQFQCPIPESGPRAYKNSPFWPRTTKVPKLDIQKKPPEIQFLHRRHALLRSFDIFAVTFRMTNFLPKLYMCYYFLGKKTEFPCSEFPYFRVLPGKGTAWDSCRGVWAWRMRPRGALWVTLGQETLMFFPGSVPQFAEAWKTWGGI